MASTEASRPTESPQRACGSAAFPPSTRPPTRAIRALGALAVLGLRAFSALPSPVARALVAPIVPLYLAIRRRHRARLRACFAASPFAGRLTLGSYYRRRLELLTESLRAHARPAADARVEIRGEEAYARAVASGRPVVLLGLHLGPWETLHRSPPAPPGRPFAIVTAPAFAPSLTAYMARGREREGKRVLWTGSRGENGMEAGLRAILRSAGILAVMADQHPGPPDGSEWIGLWGRIRVPCPGRLLRFLERRGCLFVPVSARMAAGLTVLRYHGTWDSAGPERVRAFLEQAIAEAPDQWNWSYPKVVPGPAG